MNKNILEKCIEELKKTKPNLSYVRGLLEALAETIQPKPAGENLAGLIGLKPGGPELITPESPKVISKPEGMGPADPYNPNNQDSDLKRALQNRAKL